MWVSLFSSRLSWCLRTYALWNRPRWLAMVGLPLIISESVVVLFAVMKIHYIPTPKGLHQICVASPGAGSWGILAWVVPFSLDTAMSTLSIVRAMRVSSKLKTQLTSQLIRDGAWKFLYVAVSKSDHLAGFYYYGCASLAIVISSVSLTASQADDNGVYHGIGAILGAWLLCSKYSYRFSRV